MLLIFYWTFQEEKSDIVVETSLVIVFVDYDILNIMVSVGEKLVLGLSVPFTSSYFQS